MWGTKSRTNIDRYNIIDINTLPVSRVFGARSGSPQIMIPTEGHVLSIEKNVPAAFPAQVCLLLVSMSACCSIGYDHKVASLVIDEN